MLTITIVTIPILLLLFVTYFYNPLSVIQFDYVMIFTSDSYRCRPILSL